MADGTGTGAGATGADDYQRSERASNTAGASGGAFAALARFVVRNPWKVVAGWIVVAFIVIATAPALPTTTNESSFLPSSYESIRAQTLQSQAFPQQGHVTAAASIIVFSRPDGGPLTAADQASVARVTTELNARHIPNILAVTPGVTSSNKLVQTAYVAMDNSVVNGSGSQAGDAIKALRADIKPLMTGTGLTEGVTGSAAEALDSTQSGNKALAIVGAATFLLILILLLVIFRAPIIAIMPLILIGIAYEVALGLISDVNQALDLNSTAQDSTILLVVLFGIGTDYFLFLMFRYRERLRLGDDKKEAMVQSVTRVGEVIASAACVVIAAFLALTLSSLSIFRSLGPTLAIAVAVTLIAALTLIPAVVSLIGTAVFWPSKAWQREPKGAAFTAIGGALGRRPAVFAVASGLVLILLALGALSLKPTFDLSSAGIPSTAESQTALVTLEKGFPPGETEPTQVFLHASSGPLTTAEVTSYAAKLRAMPGVGAVAAPLTSKDGATAEYNVYLKDDPESTAAVNLVQNQLRPDAHAAAPPGTEALVGGITAVFADIQKALNRDYEVVFPVAALIILVILGLLLRSLVAPWYLMVSVGLGFAATLGATVLVFQNLAGQTGLVFILPMYMYLFVVALGTDYNILMIARVREEIREGATPRVAAAHALAQAGPAIASAGLILAGTFGSLTLAGNQVLTQVGFAVAAGIALAAFVMAMFFSPSLTALIGRRAWWPGRSGQGGHAALGPAQRQRVDVVDALDAAEHRVARQREVGQPRGEERERLFQLGPGEVDAEAEVRARAEGVELAVAFGGDVERLAARRLPVGPLRADRDDRARGEEHAPVLDVLEHDPRGERRDRLEPQRLLDRLFDVGVRVGRQQRPLVGVLGEQPERLRELALGGVHAPGQQVQHQVHALVVGQPVALLLGREQRADQVGPRGRAALLEQGGHVLVGLDDRPLDVRDLAGQGGDVELPLHHARPVLEPVGVRHRGAEDGGDGPGRVGLGDRGHELGLASRRRDRPRAGPGTRAWPAASGRPPSA